jgi:hypothetical protein
MKSGQGRARKVRQGTGGNGAPQSRQGASPAPSRPGALAREVVRTEAAAVAALESRIGPEFLQAVDLLARAAGR